MKEANFSNHAKQRIGERCSLSQDDIKRILDNDGTIVIHLQKGGRYAHRLLYSVTDEDWFMVVQDGGDGGVLTVMPLEYLIPILTDYRNNESGRSVCLSVEPVVNQG